MAAGLRGENRVAVAFHGDGAANQGILYETLNLAAGVAAAARRGLREQPVRDDDPLCRLPGRGEHRGARRGLRHPRGGGGRHGRARGPGGDARGHRAGRAGEGPSYLECRTYRYAGHSLRNDRPVRSEEEIASWKARDPLPALARRLREHHGLPETEAAAIDDEERERIAGPRWPAAEAAPEPGPEMLEAGVFCDDPWEETPPPRTEADENRILSYAGALNEAHHQAMAADNRILLFGRGRGRRRGGVRGLDRPQGTVRPRTGPSTPPISEQAITGLGVGLALADARPVVEIQFMDILTLAADRS